MKEYIQLNATSIHNPDEDEFDLNSNKSELNRIYNQGNRNSKRLSYTDYNATEENILSDYTWADGGFDFAFLAAKYRINITFFSIFDDYDIYLGNKYSTTLIVPGDDRHPKYPRISFIYAEDFICSNEFIRQRVDRNLPDIRVVCFKQHYYSCYHTGFSSWVYIDRAPRDV